MDAVALDDRTFGIIPGFESCAVADGRFGERSSYSPSSRVFCFFG